MKNWLSNVGKGILLIAFALIVWPIIAITVAVLYLPMLICGELRIVPYLLGAFDAIIAMPKYILLHDIDTGSLIIKDLRNGDTDTVYQKLGL